MTLRSFGRAVPIQMNMLALVGYEFAERDLRPATGLNARKRAMMSGLHSLKKATGADFAYDAAAWRDFLIEAGEEFGYTHSYAYKTVDSAVRKALSNQDVIDALALMSNPDG